MAEEKDALPQGELPNQVRDGLGALPEGNSMEGGKGTGTVEESATSENDDRSTAQVSEEPVYVPKKASPEEGWKVVDGTVFPNEDQTILVKDDVDYGGAHEYKFLNCVGFNPKTKKAEYVDSTQTIQFVQKNHDGSVIPGLQSEQLILALLDRHQKLNNVYEHEQYVNLRHGLLMFLNASEARIRERISRDVMGDLKK